MKIKFDSILLFVLVVPFIMGYRIGTGDTPYWLFGIIFVLLGLNIVLDIVKIRENTYTLLKNITLWSIILCVIGSAFFSAIIVRHQTSPLYMIHDIILQQESAIQFLLDGRNPYSENYFGTPLEDWNYSETDVNPALYHFVMEPFYLLFSAPFYVISHRSIGFFDGRMPLLFLFFVGFVISQMLVKDPEKKRLFLILLAFNPAMLPYTLEGRSDMFMFPFVLASLYLLQKEKYSLSGIPMALAFAIKQSIWPIFPFFVAYVYFKEKNIIKTLQALVPFTVVFLVIVLPFYFWESQAFLNSTVYYLSGSTEHSYPISGYGIGKLLEQFGFIKDTYAYYPFIYWQIVFCLPLLVGLVLYLKKNTTLGNLVLVYGLFLLVYWYLSRYFNNSHLGYISVIFITSYFLTNRK